MFQKPSLEELENRYKYHAPTDEQKVKYERIRGRCLELAVFIVENTPCSRDQVLALNALDEVMFRANAAIARNE